MQLAVRSAVMVVVFALLVMPHAWPAFGGPVEQPSPGMSPSPGMAPSPGMSPTPGNTPGQGSGSSSMPAGGMGTVWAVSISRDQEVPAPKPATPATAGGVGAVVLNRARTEAGFVFTFGGLSGRVTQAHFHRGAPGSAGAVVQGICGGSGALMSSCPQGNAGTITGVWRITSALAADIDAGRIYVNLHTMLNPDGEARGQISASGMMSPGMRGPAPGVSTTPGTNR